MHDTTCLYACTMCGRNHLCDALAHAKHGKNALPNDLAGQGRMLADLCPSRYAPTSAKGGVELPIGYSTDVCSHDFSFLV